MDLPDLRPLSFGELLDRTFSYYRRHFRLFVGIMAIPQALIIATNILLQAIQAGPQTTAAGAKGSAPSPAYLLGAMFGVLVVVGAYFVLCSVALGATTFAVSEIHLGRQTTARAAYRKMRGYYWRLLDLIFTIIVRAILAFLLIMVGFVMLMGVVGAALGPVASSIVMLVAVVGLIAGSVLAVRYFFRYSCSVSALLLENLKAGPAIRRSVALTKDNIGRIFVIGLLMSLVTWAVAAILQGPFVVAGMVTAVKSHAAPPFWLNAASALAGGVGQAITGPLLMIGMVLLYYDIRVRKEGFDLQLMMAALDAQSPRAAVPQDYLLPVEPPIAEMNVVGLIGLNILTLGLYGPIWFLQKRPGINKLHSSEKLGVGLPCTVLVLMVLVALVNFDIGYNVRLIRNFEVMWASAFSSAATLAIGILMVIQAFKVRSILEAHSSAHAPGPLSGSIALLQSSSFSGVATFFFGIFYLQYKINEMVETWPQSQPALGTDAVPAL